MTLPANLPIPSPDRTEKSSLTRDQVRAVDAAAIAGGIPGIQLMENAGAGVVNRIVQLGLRGPFAIVCGKGNNGGDGFVIARRLAERGESVVVLLACNAEELQGDARIAFASLAGTAVEIASFDTGWKTAIANAEWIVDALLGTGTRGPVAGNFARVIDAMNAAGKSMFAVDLPSGLDCDSGKPLGPTVAAAHTATFVARKRGFDNVESVAYTGTVHVVDIGIPPELLVRVVARGDASQNQ